MKQILVIFILSFISLASLAKPISLKVAILENLQAQKLASDQYEKDYFAGIDAAVLDASKRGVEVTYKAFIYGKDALDILGEVEKIKQWGPDVIIGPRSSNKFLLLKDQFKDVLVISPMATVSAVSEMPKNFYSLTLPNEYSADAMVKAVAALFPGKNIFKIVESDCKSCIDIAKVFEEKFKIHNSKIQFTESKFLNDQAEKIALPELLVGYKKGDVILLSDTAYASGVISARIADYLETDGITFIGNDDWGTWKAGYFGKVRSKFKYKGIRIIPWSLDGKRPNKEKCQKAFVAKHHRSLPDGISLVSCHTVSSIVDLVASGSSETQLLKDLILKRFEETTRKNLYWARPTSYAVHEVTQDGERFLRNIKITRGVHHGTK